MVGRSLRVGVLGVVLACSACTGTWVQLGYSPGRAGSNPVESQVGVSNVAGLRSRWSTSIGTFAADPVVLNGAVFVPTWNGTANVVAALDAGTGASRWSVALPRLPQQVSEFTPVDLAVTDRAVYASHDASVAFPPATGTFPAGEVIGLDPSNGSTVFRPGRYVGFATAVALGNQLYYGGSDARFVQGRLTYTGALFGQDPSTGQISVLSQPAPSGLIDSVVAVDQGFGFVVGTANFSGPGLTLNAVPLGSGSGWSSTTSGLAANVHPVAAGGTVFAADTTGDVFAFAASGCGTTTCAPRWEAVTGAAPKNTATLAVGDGMLFVALDTGALYAFSASGCGASTCSPIWHGTIAAGTPRLGEANGVLYAISEGGGHLVAFNAAGCRTSTCSPLLDTPTGGTGLGGGPTIANGMVYVGTGDGKVIAFGL